VIGFDQKVSHFVARFRPEIYECLFVCHPRLADARTTFAAGILDSIPEKSTDVQHQTMSARQSDVFFESESFTAKPNIPS
jgi:hypothetical protein